jgi:hypothetical protein
MPAELTGLHGRFWELYPVSDSLLVIHGEADTLLKVVNYTIKP